MAETKVKNFPVSSKSVSKNKITSWCMGKSCRNNIVPENVRMYRHIVANKFNDISYRYRIGGTCPKCSTKISKIIGKELALALVKEAKVKKNKNKGNS